MFDFELDDNIHWVVETSLMRPFSSSAAFSRDHVLNYCAIAISGPMMRLMEKNWHRQNEINLLWL